MSRWTKRWASAVIGGCLMTGCANVEVHKVDVEKRIQGCDQDVKGFRYYLTRPYLVVSDRVPVATRYVPVALALFPAHVPLEQGKPLPQGVEVCLVALVPDNQGLYRVYDRAGCLRPEITPEMVQVLPRKSGAPNQSRTYLDLRTNVRLAIEQEVLTQYKNQKRTSDDESKLAKGIDDAIDKSKMKTDVDSGNPTQGVQVGAQAALDFAKGYLATTPPWSKSQPPIKLTLTANQITKQVLPSSPGPAPGGVMELGMPRKLTSVTLAAGALANAPPNPQPQPNPPLTPPPPFQVIFLPDFEEQYAIKNCNFLAKTNYKYNFSNGTTLTTMAGNYDSTDVPIQIVETVKALITSAGEVAKTRLANFPVLNTSKTGFAMAQNLTTADYFLRFDMAIEPGVYRVQKSWEKVAAAQHDGQPHEDFCGLFADIGLPVHETTSVITSTEHNAATGGGSGSK